MSEESVTYSEMFAHKTLYGQVCIACAMSADDDFVESMLESFTEFESSHRSFYGDKKLFLMLNKDQAFLSKDIPGFVQLGPINQKKWEQNVSVQHAKVALMLFGDNCEDQNFVVNENSVWRLIVCTGNWTETSAKKQVELVWSIEVPYKDIGASSPWSQKQNIADLVAATKFIEKLRTLYSCNEDLWKKAKEFLDDIKERFFNVNGLPSSRFVCTLPSSMGDTQGGQPLFSQIYKAFGNENNWMLAGSGFFENPEKNSHKPDVLCELEKLVPNANEKILVVNENNAGQVAVWKKGSKSGTEDWRIVSCMDDCNRYLHAKYIFVAKSEISKQRLNEGKLYIGSGNLSRKGLLSAYGNAGEDVEGKKGNIEAGVIIDIGSTTIKKIKESLACSDNAVDAGKIEPGTENDDETNDSFKGAFPITALKIKGDKEKQIAIIWDLENSDHNGKIFQITIGAHSLDSEFEFGKDSFLSLEECGLNLLQIPSRILVRLTQDNALNESEPIESEVFVLNEDGKPVVKVENINGVDDLADNMDDFDKYTPFGGDGGDGDDGSGTPDDSPSESTESYPFCEAMRLVELVADKTNQWYEYQKKKKGDIEVALKSWIYRWETLLRSLNPEFVKQMQNINVDFISVLKNYNDGFAPDMGDDLNRIWDSFIDRWKSLWKLNDDSLWRI